ncbi:MAG: hypothetical protein HKN48_05715 [Flavobacteriaceae bacterium]|nr:hypothetical protein [Flavobacteriaceae bacterium]
MFTKKFLATLVVIFCTYYLPVLSQKFDGEVLLSEVIKSAKERSLYASEVNWDSLQTSLIKQYGSSTNMEQLKPALSEILNALRDHHGSFFQNNQRIAVFTNNENTRKTDRRSYDSEIWQQVNYDSSHEFKMLDDTTGYIKLVGIGPVDIIAEAKKLREKFEKLAVQGATQWVLDLRYNGGGNMYPMLQSLTPLLGDGPIGCDSNLKGEKSFEREVKDGDFYYGEYLAIDLPESKTKQSNAKVVVLLSRYTVSSGEIVATSFKGRANTCFVGEATGGYTTVTNFEPINEDLTMSISVAYYTDRNGKIYTENVTPDIEVPFKIEKEVSKDEGVQKAMELLKNNLKY